MKRRMHKACGCQVHFVIFIKGYYCKECDKEVEAYETVETHPFWQHIRIVTYKGINPPDVANRLLGMLRDGVSNA